MILPIIEPEKTGRNEPCPCGSGKKYKKCCMAKKHKAMNPQTLSECFMWLIKEKHGGKIDISCDDLKTLLSCGKTTGLGVKYDQEEDSFHFETIECKVGKIVQPKRIII